MKDNTKKDLVSRDKVLQVIRNCYGKADSKDTYFMLIETAIEMMDEEEHWHAP